MNDSAARKFCASRWRWPIVSIVTIVLGLVIVLPLADDYFTNIENRRALAEQLLLAKATAETLPALEQRVLAQAEHLAELESHAVGEKTIGSYRRRLVEMVRESGCQMRNIGVSEVNCRAWIEGDSPLTVRQPEKNSNKKTPFFLERRSMLLSVGGTSADVNNLLKKLQETLTFTHPRRLVMQSAGRGGKKVTMEIEFWLFTLVRQDA